MMSALWTALVLAGGGAALAPAVAQAQITAPAPAAAPPQASAKSGSPLLNFQAELPQLRMMGARAAWQRLLHPPAHWLSDAEYHYWRGVFALEAGEPADARDSFERALMINPDHAGAMYDYGLTLCRLGERSSCLELLASARAQFGLPPALSPSSRYQLLAEGRTGLGRSSNLNRAPLRGTLTVQIDGGSLDLQLSDDFKPRPGNYLELAADLRLVQLETGARVGLSAYTRSAPGQDDIGLVAGELRYPLGERHQVGLQAYGLSEGSARGLDAAGAVWEWLPGPAWKSVNLSLEQRRLRETGVSYPAVRVDTRWQAAPALLLNAYVEAEGRSDQRAGEAGRRVGLGLARDLGSTRAGQLDAGARISHAADIGAYSALFGDTRRRLTQAELSLRLTTPLPWQALEAVGSPRLRTDLRGFAQRSNIALFDVREWQLQLSLVWSLQK